MYRLTSPPRTSVVRIDQPNFKGEMRTLTTLPETINPQKLRELISGDQLAVSSDGLHSAHIFVSDRTNEHVHHNLLGFVGPRFLRPAKSGIGTRILQVGAHYVLAWGHTQGHPPGLWFLTAGGSRYLLRLDKLMRAKPARASRLIKGVDDTRPGEVIYLTPWGSWPVDEGALVADDIAGLSVVETLGNNLYAYRVGSHVDPFHLLTLLEGSHPIGIVRWQGRMMLAVRRGSQSWLTELTHTAPGTIPMRLPVDGDLLGLWSSPHGKTLAMLVHPRDTSADFRRLQLSDGRIVHEGHFEVDPRLLGWSPDEYALIATIHTSTGIDQVATQQMVGTHTRYRLPVGMGVRELLVNNAGQLEAMIRYDDQYDQPVVAGQVMTRYDLAWNLHYGPDGIMWNSVHADRVLAWTFRRPMNLGTRITH